MRTRWRKGRGGVPRNLGHGDREGIKVDCRVFQVSMREFGGPSVGGRHGHESEGKPPKSLVKWVSARPKDLLRDPDVMGIGSPITVGDVHGDYAAWVRCLGTEWEVGAIRREGEGGFSLVFGGWR